MDLSGITILPLKAVNEISNGQSSVTPITFPLKLFINIRASVSSDLRSSSFDLSRMLYSSKKIFQIEVHSIWNIFFHATFNLKYLFQCIIRIGISFLKKCVAQNKKYAIQQQNDQPHYYGVMPCIIINIR